MEPRIYLLLVIGSFYGAVAQPVFGVANFPGKYCERQFTRPCCSGRQDNCTVAIEDTLCYCDEFCGQIPNHDCCPDYYSYCYPGGTPEFCHFKGSRVRARTSFSDNCNKCYCGTNGRVTCENNECLVNEELINMVNSLSFSLGWTAGNYSGFWGRTLYEGLARRLGTFEPISVKEMYKMTIKSKVELPRQFNAVNQWPRFIKDVRDQGWCGSSWAMSTASVASDRFSIHSKGVENVELSPQNFLSCDTTGQYGCGGGHVDKAWSYFRLSGVVEERCYPYNRQPDQCRFPKGRNATLITANCLPPRSLRTTFYKTGPAIPLNGEKDVMTEIFQKGPVQATMQVFPDFFVYKSGVYRRSGVPNPHSQSGWHSVKIVGWGEERKGSEIVKYWIAANSWGKWWGEAGYFRILRGQNHCGIEEYMFTVSVDTQK